MRKWLSLILALSWAIPGGRALGLERTEDDLSLWASEGRWPRSTNAVEPTAQMQFDKAKRLEAIGDVLQAAVSYRRLADVYSVSDQAELSLVLSAKCYLSAGRYGMCRDTMTELRRQFNHPNFLDDMGYVEVNLARGYLEGKGEGGTFKLGSRVRKAKAIYAFILKEDPEGRWADDAKFGLGMCSEALRDWDTALQTYKEFMEKYPNSELRSEVEGHIAECIDKRDPIPDYSEEPTVQALRRIQDLKEDAAQGDADVDIVQLQEHEKVLIDRQAQKRYDQALFYVKNGHFRAAEVYLELIKTRYPESPWAKKAESLLFEIRKR